MLATMCMPSVGSTWTSFTNVKPYGPGVPGCATTVHGSPSGALSERRTIPKLVPTTM